MIKNIYLDKSDAVKKYCHPRHGAVHNIVGYLTIFASLKSENNETAIGIIHVGDKQTKTLAETRRFLAGISPEISEMMTDESVERFMNQQPRNIHKSIKCNRFYNGENIVIIGDAAHPFRPIGQGINIALLDAMWLC